MAIVLSGMVMGLSDTVGSYYPFITSYYIGANDQSTASFGSVLGVTAVIGNICGIKMITSRFKYWHPRMQYVIVYLFLGGGHFIGAQCTTVNDFAWTFVPMYGLALGYMGMTPIFVGYLYFPENKSRMNGIYESTNALSAGLVKPLLLYWLNPEHISPAKGDHDDPNYKQFPTIADNLPKTMRKFAILYGVLIGLIFIIFPDYPI